MTDPAAFPRPARLPHWARPTLVGVAAALLLATLVPPLQSLAGRYEFIEALRFSIFAVAVPALLVLGAPWSLRRTVGRRAPGQDGLVTAEKVTGRMDRLAAQRRRHLGAGRSVSVLLIEMVLLVVCRTPFVVDTLAGRPWLVPLEAACLIPGGVALWLELVESPPLSPRLNRPKRAVLAALTMWTIWISAYLVGLSHTAVYGHYHGLSGGGLSLAADQEIGTFVLWFVAAAAFVPTVFWNLVTWLRAEEDPDDGLHRLVRESRRRTWGPPVGGAGIVQRRSGGSG